MRAHASIDGGWRGMLTLAADLAVIGFAVTAAALPLLTAGAALRTGSVAVRAIAVEGRKATLAELWQVFRRNLLPGCAATILTAAAVAFLILDIGAVGNGRVPGGYPVLAALGVAAAILVAVCGLTVLRLGHDPAGSWRSAVRWAGQTAGRQPVVAATVAGVLTVAAAIGVLVPATLPISVGYALFALHAIGERLIRS
jgi:hypothetical protein